MKIHIFLLFLYCGIVSAQKEFSYDKTRIELEKSTETLCTVLYKQNKSHYVGIVTDYLIIENIDLNPCIDIETDGIKNQLILDALKKYSLLDNLYLDTGDGFINIDSTKNIVPKEKELIIELTYKSNFAIAPISILVTDEKTAKKLIRDFIRIFSHKKCFKKLK